MLIDIHNHTPLCNHATGTPEEFIKKAIKKGIDIYGFADHAPMEFDQKYRMGFEDMPKYENEINTLKEKYKNKIKILLGYEVDFTPYVDKRVLGRKVDFLIGSVHFLNNWGFDNPEFIKEWEKRDIDDVYKEYFSKIKEMAESKLFDIVGHLDLVKVFGFIPKKNIKDLAKEAIKTIKKSDMAVEINTSGLRKKVNEIYPSVELLKIIKDEGIDITFSSDAHKTQDVGYKITQAVELAKKIGFSEAVYFENRVKQKIKLT
jgi:histidinol-phosphatase (PHP family)